ncbi:MAG TPA: sensor histidine kinase, partial [Bacteroidales bacterium]|nr:sensor histidine kinase [Bacteroidales bacterium]
EALEEERTQISRDLHDSLGQSLTGLKMYASRLHSGILNQSGPETPKLAGQVEEMITVINSLMQLIRKIAKRLRPQILDDMGLIPALESQLEEFNLQSGISYTFDNHLEKIPMAPKFRIEVFRIFQEVLTNVIRHSKATAVRVSISNNHLSTRISIEDNGIGIPEIDIWKMKTLGLLGMKERAAVFGGTLDISGIEGKGTTVTIEIPLFKKDS